MYVIEDKQGNRKDPDGIPRSRYFRKKDEKFTQGFSFQFLQVYTKNERGIYPD